MNDTISAADGGDMSVYTAIDLERQFETTAQGLPDGRYVPARPINYICDGWRLRARIAWRVFRGRYDAIDWENAK